MSCPPSREYKQSMAMQASPPPRPMKGKSKYYCLRIYWELVEKLIRCNTEVSPSEAGINRGSVTHKISNYRWFE